MYRSHRSVVLELRRSWDNRHVMSLVSMMFCVALQRCYGE